jgi:hypothetical protein
MPLPPRLFPGDEELGKKDDDHKPGVNSPLRISWRQWRLSHGPHRRNMKRVALGLVILTCIYYIFKNMPTHLENPRPQPAYDHTSGQTRLAAGSWSLPPASQGSVRVHEEITEAEQHYFNGPINFYQLSSTLRAVSKTRGSELVNQNRNVVRALESLHTSLLITA